MSAVEIRLARHARSLDIREVINRSTGGARLPGLALAAAVAIAATALAAVLGLGSAPVLAIALGLLVTAAVGPRDQLRAGLRFGSSIPLRSAVVVLGAELPLNVVIAQGGRSLPGILITLLGGLAAGRVLGARLGVTRRLRTLVAVGTSICGASAIAAVTPVIEADETEVGYSVSTIFLFNIAAVLVFPLLGHALGMSQGHFGAFAGTAVNDLSSVVAAASIYGGASLHTAVIVKLTRTLMIVPVCGYLARGWRDRARGDSRPWPVSRDLASVGGIVSSAPTFLLGFLALAALRGLGMIPTAAAGAISHLAAWLITLALAAVGLSVDIGELRRAGTRPVVLGAMLWATVSALALGCQAIGLL